MIAIKSAVNLWNLRVFIGLALAVFCLSLSLPLLDISLVAAVPPPGPETATWTDRGDVTYNYNGEKFVAITSGGIDTGIDVSHPETADNTEVFQGGACSSGSESGPETFYDTLIIHVPFANQPPTRVDVTLYKQSGNEKSGTFCASENHQAKMTNTYYSVSGATTATWIDAKLYLGDLKQDHTPQYESYEYIIRYDGAYFESTSPATASPTASTVFTADHPSGMSDYRAGSDNTGGCGESDGTYYNQLTLGGSYLNPTSLTVNNIENRTGDEHSGKCSYTGPINVSLTNSYSDVTTANFAWNGNEVIRNLVPFSILSEPKQLVGDFGRTGGDTNNTVLLASPLWFLAQNPTYQVGFHCNGAMMFFTTTPTINDALTAYAVYGPCAEQGTGPGYAAVPVYLSNSLNDAASTSSGGNNADQCPVNQGSLGWLLCPVYDLLSGAIKGLNGQIQNYLYVNTDNIFGTSGQSSSFQSAFNNFRDIGVGLLVLAGLFMVVSQAAGLEIFSAHTIRKALPRVVVAAIGMSLVWPILQFAVTFFNDLGTLVSNIILATASINSTTTTTPTYAYIGGSVIDSIVGLLAGAAVVVALGALGLLSMLGTILLGLLVGLLVLAIRQLVIIVCILLAPLAIASAVLPGTEKFWKLWKDTLLGALLMFPIVMAFLAAGAALASIASQNGSTGIIGIIAYFAPYFMLPFAFRMAGGLMSSLTGGVSNVFGGGFGFLKKVRQNERAKNWQAFGAGSRYSNRGIGRVINDIGRRTHAGLRGRFGFGETGRTALTLDSAAEVERTLKSNPRLTQLANDDDANAVLGLSGGTRAGAVLAAQRLFRKRDKDGNWSRDAAGNFIIDNDKVDRTVAAASAVGFNRANATAALTTMAQSKSRAVYAGDIDAVQEGINRLAGRNMTMANNLAYGYQFNSRQAGRFDLGGAWHTSDIRASAAAMQAKAAATTGAPAADQDMARAVSMATMLDGFDRSDLSSIARGHTNEIRAGLDSIDYAMQYGNADQQITAAHHILELQSSLPYTIEGNKELINRWMESRGYRVGDTRATLAQQVAHNLISRSNDGTRRADGSLRGSYPANDENAFARMLDAEARVYGQEAYRQNAATGGGPVGTS